MYDISTLAPVSQSRASRRRNGLASLLAMIATLRARRRFRHDLERMSTDNPYLIDDIGLTGRQVRTEIAKHFWQA